MSGPQGPDPTEPYSGPYSGSQPYPGAQPYPGSQPPSDETQAGYAPPQYPSYQQPSTPGYAEQYPQNQPYGGGQFGQQPGQFGQFGQQPDAGASSKSKKGLGAVIAVIGVLVVMVIVAAVLVLGFWKPGFFVTTKLDIDNAQAGVEQVLTDETNGYGANNVKDVNCNDGESPTVKKGDTFDCDVTIDNNHKKVKVTFLDDDGTYEVGRPTAG